MSAEPGRARATPEGIEKELRSLPGVNAVDLSDYPERVTLHCEIDGARWLAAEAVRQQIDRLGGGDPEIRMEVATSIPKTKRARFDSIELSQVNPGVLRARATLDWQRKHFVGEAEEETSPAGEMRACALATVRAVEKVADGQVTFSLIGVKEVHVFDHNLVAVLLHSPQLPGYRMIGTSIITEDRRRSTALAALSATNRAVGNFIEG